MFKTSIGIIAVILTFAGYVPYLRDICASKTKPHLYSWFLWGFVTTIVFALQLSGGAGVGAFVTLAAASMCFVVILLGRKYGSTSEVTSSDKIFLVLAFIALGMWVFAKQPLLSTVLATTIDLLGFAPTIRKSWKEPFSETLSFYYLNTLRFGLALYSLERYTIITALYPFTWLLANSLFALLLILRRKQTNKQKNLNAAS